MRKTREFELDWAANERFGRAARNRNSGRLIPCLSPGSLIMGRRPLGRVALMCLVSLLGWSGTGNFAQAQTVRGPAPEPVPAVPAPPFRTMDQLNLRVPTPEQLGGGAAAEPVEIPDYAAAAFRPLPHYLVGMGGDRPWTGTIVNWQAPGYVHRPLYFQQWNLERHGHSFGLAQPALSAGDALARVVALPALMVMYPPHSRVYSLGEPRPGDGVPYHRPAIGCPERTLR